MQTLPSPKGVQNNHMATLVKAAKQQTTPELFGMFRNLPPGPTPPRAGTFRNLSPEPTPARAGTCLRNPQQHKPWLQLRPRGQLWFFHGFRLGNRKNHGLLILAAQRKMFWTEIRLGRAAFSHRQPACKPRG